MLRYLLYPLLCLLAGLAPAQTGPGAASDAEVVPGVLRTPDERFANLPGFDFEPNYVMFGDYRIHFLDEGPPDAAPVLLIHGEPTWSYLYRKMVPVLTAGGHRVVVPDLIGFGRSDKPVAMETHSYTFHVAAMSRLVETLNLRRATFFGQDWGGLIGLRVVAENEARFARVVVSNTGLPTGDEPVSEAFMNWRRVNQVMIDRGDMPVGAMLAESTGDPAVAIAYDAPFPEPRFKAGPLILPQLVPVSADDPAHRDNVRAWQVFERWRKPFLTAFGDADPITAGRDRAFRERIPGARGQPHTVLQGGRHFIQESHGAELAGLIDEFIRANPVSE